MTSSTHIQYKILFLGTQMALAGAQNVLVNQAAWFYEQGYQVTIVYFYDKQELEHIWRAKYPFTIINLNAWNAYRNGVSNFIKLCIGLVKLFSLIRKNKFDVIESFTPHSNLLGLPVAWLAGVPVRIGSHHGKIEDSPFWLPWLHGKLINSRIANYLIAVSNQVKDYALSDERVKENKVKVILNGINLPQSLMINGPHKMNLLDELGIDKDYQLILSVGRLTLQKGYTYLLDSIPYVLKKFPHTIFAIAGAGYFLERLDKKAQQLEIENHIRFLGLRDDIADLLLAADVFVLPSLWEGLPIAMLEAMSFGVPVIATQVGGIDDVIENEISGLVIPPKNFEALAKAIIRFLENPGEAKKLGRAGRERVFLYHTVDQMCESYEDVFLHFLHETSQYGDT